MSKLDVLLALDFGGTKLSAATVTAGRRATDPLLWLNHQRHYSPGNVDASYELQAMIALAHIVLEGHQPAAVGISFGGPVDTEKGLVRLSHHVPGWEAIALAALLESEFDAPTLIDNDANVAALGEHRLGAGRGLSSLLYVTVSTGVGGGWIVGGRPWRGHDGMAGEIGHIVVDPAGPLCLCGKRGCVERLASGPTMAQDAAEQLAQHPEDTSILRERLAANGTLTGRAVAEAAALGDVLARSILLRGAQALGSGLGNAANLVNPQRFILGGGITKSGVLWWNGVRQSARATALAEISIDIVPAALGDDAPLWGAVVLARQALRQARS